MLDQTGENTMNSKEEVVFGMKDLLEKSGYSDLFELLSGI